MYSCSDCDDGDAGVNPGATDIPDDGLDQDCDGVDATSGYTYSYAADIEPLWQDVCITCHNSIMNLTTGQSYDAMVNVRSTQVAALYTVLAGDPSRSYLLNKLRGTHLDVGGRGDQMPPGGPYWDEATIQMVETWIAEGAPNN